jgi:hypothetical protein
MEVLTGVQVPNEESPQTRMRPRAFESIPSPAKLQLGLTNSDCLSRAAAANEMHDDHDDSDHQKYVNESHRHVKGQKPQQPQNE